MYVDVLVFNDINDINDEVSPDFPNFLKDVISFGFSKKINEFLQEILKKNL